jgi:hypothetical protein
MRRRPLLRAAAVGGGAYAMGKHAERKQAEAQEDAYYAGQQSAMAAAPPPAPPAAPAPATGGGLSDADVAQLQQLAKLREQGILTDEEFDQQKKLILGI